MISAASRYVCMRMHTAGGSLSGNVSQNGGGKKGGARVKCVERGKKSLLCTSQIYSKSNGYYYID